MTTKEQLEAIWNGTEIGWLSRQHKVRKNKTQRKIRINFYEKVTKHTIEETVWAGKNDTAMSLSWPIVNRHYPTSKEMPTSNYEVRFVND
jgi:hypothetical protein